VIDSTAPDLKWKNPPQIIFKVPNSQTNNMNFRDKWLAIFHDIWRNGSGLAQSFAAKNEPARLGDAK
jgi:hypothetical protein